METDAERNITALKIPRLDDLVKRQTAQLETLTKATVRGAGSQDAGHGCKSD